MQLYGSALWLAYGSMARKQTLVYEEDKYLFMDCVTLIDNFVKNLGFLARVKHISSQ